MRFPCFKTLVSHFSLSNIWYWTLQLYLSMYMGSFTSSSIYMVMLSPGFSAPRPIYFELVLQSINFCVQIIMGTPLVKDIMNHSLFILSDYFVYCLHLLSFRHYHHPDPVSLVLFLLFALLLILLILLILIRVTVNCIGWPSGCYCLDPKTNDGHHWLQ